MRALFALFLSMLIGNPVCCCAFTSPSGDSQAEAAMLPPCCQARLKGVPVEQKPAQEESPGMPCPCAVEVGVVSPDKVFVPTAPFLNWLPAIPVQTALVGPGRYGRNVRWLPSGVTTSFMVASPPPRLLYGVFRC